MKKTTLFLILSLFSLTLFAQAQEQDSSGDTTPQMEQMQTRMRALMEQIQATEDPDERHRLMQEHMQGMHQGMMMMGEMMRGRMGQSADQGAGQGGRTQECQQNDMQCRVERMQMQQGAMGERMGMMQQMMQQMMEHMMQGQATDQPAEGEANHEAHH
jgi:hypothetical protein